MPKLLCPAGGTGASFDGIEYVADENGVIEVPHEAILPLFDHGFILAPDQDVVVVPKKGKLPPVQVPQA